MTRNIRITGAIFFMLLLTGCPGPGDRFTPDEATWVQPAQGKVCFTVTHAQDYKAALIAIT